MSTLRSKIIRLAHANPALRPHLLPLVKAAAWVSPTDAPKPLQDLIKKVVAATKRKLVDPSLLNVETHRRFDRDGTPFFAGILKVLVPTTYGGMKPVTLWLRGDPTGTLELLMALGEGEDAPNSYAWKPATASGAVDLLLAKTKGWTNIKGEAEGRIQREGTAKAIAGVLNSLVGRMGIMSGKATISPDFRSIEAAYRSGSLPKEGANAVGEYEYDNMVAAEINRAKKTIAPVLAPYQDKIAKTSFHDGEKSWIYITVNLK